MADKISNKNMEADMTDTECNTTTSTTQEKNVNDEQKSLQNEILSLNDKVLRLAAELQNLKLRTEKEKSDISKFAISNFAKDVLTIRDNLLLALNSCSDTDNKIVEGIKMTVTQMDNILEKQGIRMIVSLNKKFDPTVHQAINEVESDLAKGTVVAVMQEGFTIADRLLRPALVSVAK